MRLTSPHTSRRSDRESIVARVVPSPTPSTAILAAGVGRAPRFDSGEKKPERPCPQFRLRCPSWSGFLLPPWSTSAGTRGPTRRRRPSVSGLLATGPICSPSSPIRRCRRPTTPPSGRYARWTSAARSAGNPLQSGLADPDGLAVAGRHLGPARPRPHSGARGERTRVPRQSPAPSFRRAVGLRQTRVDQCQINAIPHRASSHATGLSSSPPNTPTSRRRTHRPHDRLVRSSSSKLEARNSFRGCYGLGTLAAWKIHRASPTRPTSPTTSGPSSDTARGRWPSSPKVRKTRHA
jgi:hypothetical protein